ncbi:MAG: RagB/SusD family nutrient uptake outer membrane protein, partial [Tannerellaceae bacterium]|nr:RagB/SusD family nutrient uptake outer membrane protein [Tannerellaceae bacterium]
MKRIIKSILYFVLPGVCLLSCDLDKHPLNSYNEYNIAGDDSDSQYQTKEDISGALINMYNNIKSGIQERGFQDLLVRTESGTDNAYSGSPGTQSLIAVETHTIDSENSNVSRDWEYYLERVNDANQIITYIGDIEDPALTDSERNQWKAEALIWRAFNFFEMSLLWGDIPMITDAPPAITAENINEVFPLYYPARTEQVEVFKQIVTDLEWAVQYAPNLDNSDKFKMSKAVGYGLLARVYAEKPIRDYTKVIQYCQAVEAMNLRLVDDFAVLWSWNEDRTDMLGRHSSESIFEVPYTKSEGNWVWMMFWRNGMSSNLNDSFTWQKWTTPSRNLISHYEREGDEVRKNQAIIWDECGWSTYYPSDNYP